ncbi:hypothetical protein AB0J63_47040 [Streptosporangium canum]|uniref:hypothetical protein n=1 Tax=Streptosporangium canum TaxID=324952 RepID=UPI00341F0233
MRLTAQRILADHLRDDRPADQRPTLPAASAFWEGMGLNLTGATLIDFDLTGGHVTNGVEEQPLAVRTILLLVAAVSWPNVKRQEAQTI